MHETYDKMHVTVIWPPLFAIPVVGRVALIGAFPLALAFLFVPCVFFAFVVQRL